MPDAFDTVEEFWSWSDVKHAQARAGEHSLAAFRLKLASYLGVEEGGVQLAPSGHQGLEWLLKALRDSRRVVLVPAFNCCVVQQAIEQAGFIVKLYDFSPHPGMFDWQKVIDAIDDSVGAIVITHYFGVPVDFRSIIEKCRRLNVSIIEDCAHTLGAKIAERNAGTIADAAIFSFNYDKPISLGWGGFVVVNNNESFDFLNQPNCFNMPSQDTEMALLRQFVDAMNIRRLSIPYQNGFVYKIARKARILRTSNFLKSQDVSVGAIQAELGIMCLEKYPEVLEQRVANAAVLATRSDAETWPVCGGVKPAWLKQKVKVRDKQALHRISTSLQNKGYRVGNFNWPTLIEGFGKESCHNSMEVATLWIDVPIHQNMEQSGLTEIVTLLNRTSR